MKTTNFLSTLIFSFLTFSCAQVHSQVLFDKTAPPPSRSFAPSTGNHFRAFHITPVNVPFVYRVGGTKTVEPSFISAGATIGYVWGRDITGAGGAITKSRFMGGGVIVGLANVAYNSQNNDAVGLPTGINNISAYYGVYSVISVYTIQLIPAVGFQTAMGPYADNWKNQNKFWIGLGFGISLYKI
jgi:hypothetical protein